MTGANLEGNEGAITTLATMIKSSTRPCQVISEISKVEPLLSNAEIQAAIVERIEDIAKAIKSPRLVEAEFDGIVQVNIHNAPK
ncbi:MAG: hypothetical protein ACFE7R_04440, partial [Candidatus Hodarchaeota archaeon]